LALFLRILNVIMTNSAMNATMQCNGRLLPADTAENEDILGLVLMIFERNSDKFGNNGRLLWYSDLRERRQSI
jgi:hypothetical protein